jgi:hypothetical protein
MRLLNLFRRNKSTSYAHRKTSETVVKRGRPPGRFKKTRLNLYVRADLLSIYKDLCHSNDLALSEVFDYYMQQDIENKSKLKRKIALLSSPP